MLFLSCFLFFLSHIFQSVSFLLDVPCLICFFSVFQTLLKHCVSTDVVKCSLLFFIFILQTSLISFFPPSPLGIHKKIPFMHRRKVLNKLEGLHFINLLSCIIYSYIIYQDVIQRINFWFGFVSFLTNFVTYLFSPTSQYFQFTVLLNCFAS